MKTLHWGKKENKIQFIVVNLQVANYRYNRSLLRK